MTAKTARLLVDGNGQIIPNQYYDAATNSFIAGSSTNPLPISQLDGGAVSGTVIGTAANQATSGIPTVLFITSMLNYESITVQVTSAGSNCAIAYETSDDNTTWYSSGGMVVTNTGQNVPVATSTTVASYQFPRKGLYFRARVSTYGSGSTVSVVGTLSKVPVQQSSATYILGTATEGGVLVANLVPTSIEARTTSKSFVSNATYIRPIATVDGRQITRLNSIPENEWQYAAASGGITNTSDVVLAGAQGANIKNYLTGLSIANANTTATEVVVKDGSIVIWRMYLAANAPIQNIKFTTPLQSTANTALNVACITTGSQTYVNAQGYKAP